MLHKNRRLEHRRIFFHYYKRGGVCDTKFRDSSIVGYFFIIIREGNGKGNGNGKGRGKEEETEEETEEGEEKKRKRGTPL